METLPLLPLRDIIVFPYMVVPLFVGREKSIAAIDRAMKGSKEIFLAAQKRAKVNDPALEDIYPVGTICNVIHFFHLPDSTVKVLAEGKRRARVKRHLPTAEFFEVEVEEIAEDGTESADVKALMLALKGSFQDYALLSKRLPPELLLSIRGLEDPVRLAYTVVTYLNLTLPEKQQVLELEGTRERLQKLNDLSQAQIEVLRMETWIRARAKKSPPELPPEGPDEPLEEAHRAVAELYDRRGERFSSPSKRPTADELVSLAMKLLDDDLQKALREALEESRLQALAIFLREMS